MLVNTNTKKKSFWLKYRIWIILGSIILFLPPLSFLFQFSGDTNFCGAWCPRMFLVWRAGTTLKGFTLSLLRSYMGVILIFSIFATTFFLGRHWCSHLCPVGGSMELGNRFIPKRLKINYSGIPAPFFRYGYLAVYFIAPALGVGSLCCNYCNFATIPRLFGAAFNQADMAYFFRTAGLINLGLVVILGFLAKGGRAYCNLLCPVGALDAISNRIGSRFGKRIRVDNLKCNGCNACSAVCPTWAIEMSKDKAAIDQLSCMPCRACQKICPKEAISYE